MPTCTEPPTLFILALAAPAGGGDSNSSNNTGANDANRGGAGGSGGSGGTENVAAGGTDTNASTLTGDATNGTGGFDGSGDGGITVGSTSNITATSTDGISGAGGASGGSDGEGTTGSGGSSGNGGTGGTGPTGAIGVLGEACDSPGQLACAGYHQKLTVVCGGDGEWQVNQTCEAGEYCNSAEGEDAGLCLAPSEECLDRPLDETTCVEGSVYSCAPDGLGEALAEHCPAGCLDGACVAGEPCFTGEAYNCDPACGDIEAQCYDGIIDRGLDEDDFVLRTNPDDTLPGDCTTRFGYAFDPGPSWVRVSAAPPWFVAEYTPGDECAVAGSQCFAGSAEYVLTFTEDPDAMPANVTIEYVEADATCP